MPQLHETVMGHRLIEGTLPRIAEQLQRVADSLEVVKIKTTEELNYLKELDVANKKIDELVKFLEYTEGLTTDRDTQERIRNFMRSKGFWPNF